jgi:DNA-binding NarL/FixJ family response regulator
MAERIIIEVTSQEELTEKLAEYPDAVVLVLRENAPIQDPLNLLTASEQLVLHEIAKGKTTKEIAFERNLSFHTINTHRKNIFRKLEVNNVHEAIKYALRTGIIDLTEYYI